MVFTLKPFRIRELARDGLVTLIATPLLVRQALTLGMETLCVDLDLQSEALLCELFDCLVLLISPSFCFRSGWLEFPRMMGRLMKNVESSDCTTHGHLDGSLGFSVHRPCTAASDGAWELLMDVNESRIDDQDPTILTLDQKQCFDRLQLASLRELGPPSCLEGVGGVWSTGEISVL